MGLRVINGPQTEPVSAQEVLDYIGILDAGQAAYASTLIAPVREWCEQHLQRSLITQTRERTLDAFPSTQGIELSFPPVQSITSIIYADPATGADVQMPAGDYVLDNANDQRTHWVLPAYGKSWPSARAVPNAVRVRYVAGWQNADQVPKAIKHWLLAHIASFDAERAAHTDSVMAVHPVPFMDRIVDRWRIVGVV